MKVLLIDGDPVVAALLIEVFGRDGIQVTHAPSVATGTALVRADEFSAILLAVVFRDGSGLDLLSSLREEGVQTPVLLLTSADSNADVIAGFERGADDYVTKPFSVPVLAARVRAAVQRTNPDRQANLDFGGLRMDRLARTVSVADRQVKLTPTEFKLLEYLLLHAGRPVPGSELLEKVWGMHFDPGTAMLPANITRLRGKLGAVGLADTVRTIRGSGYTVDRASAVTRESHRSPMTPLPG